METIFFIKKIGVDTNLGLNTRSPNFDSYTCPKVTKISAPDSLPKNVVSNISRCGPPGNFPNMCPPPSLTYLVSLTSLLDQKLAELTKCEFLSMNLCSYTLSFVHFTLAKYAMNHQNQGLFIWKDFNVYLSDISKPFKIWFQRFWLSEV